MHRPSTGRVWQPMQLAGLQPEARSPGALADVFGVHIDPVTGASMGCKAPRHWQGFADHVQGVPVH